MAEVTLMDRATERLIRGGLAAPQHGPGVRLIQLALRWETGEPLVDAAGGHRTLVLPADGPVPVAGDVLRLPAGADAGAGGAVQEPLVVRVVERVWDTVTVGGGLVLVVR